MPDTVPQIDPAADEQSGAGYGNNALTDDVGKPDQADADEPEAHPS